MAANNNQMSNPQNWITAYTKADVEFVLDRHSCMTADAICKELNITELALKEIINVNATTNDTTKGNTTDH